MKKSSFFGYVALASVAAYFYYTKNEENTTSLKGINIDIDPDKLLDSALAYKRVREDYREPIKNVANKVLSKFMSRGEE